MDTKADDEFFRWHEKEFRTFAHFVKKWAPTFYVVVAVAVLLAGIFSAVNYGLDR